MIPQVPADQTRTVLGCIAFCAAASVEVLDCQRGSQPLAFNARAYRERTRLIATGHSLVVAELPLADPWSPLAALPPVWGFFV